MRLPGNSGGTARDRREGPGGRQLRTFTSSSCRGDLRFDPVHADLGRVAERDCSVALLPVGHADGISRALGRSMPVLLGGRWRPLIGLVCMDRIVVYLGTDTDVTEGDRAVLFEELRAPPGARLGGLARSGRPPPRSSADCVVGSSGVISLARSIFPVQSAAGALSTERTGQHTRGNCRECRSVNVSHRAGVPGRYRPVAARHRRSHMVSC
ncbi:alanine racemase C-terminal domain-containing protein [Rhodococcus aetherivorans]|uniref:alanine racemase C-terminal domain-containing protein n=1 Tax=Rhodococcus TaxID=1827 RepID=UPI0030B87321